MGHRALREFIDYKTSMITNEDPLRGLLFYQDLGFCHTLHVLKSMSGQIPKRSNFKLAANSPGFPGEILLLSSLLLSRLELSDTTSMSLTYEPSSELGEIR